MEKKCYKCKILKPLNKYKKYTNKKNSYSKTCKVCLNEMDIETDKKKNLRKQTLENFIAKCERCNENNPLKNFAKLKKFYKKKICLDCYPKFLTEQKTEWCRKKRQSNINYRLKKSLAACLRSVLIKNNTTMNYIGCNIPYLREWFEYNFTKDMNWDNYGSYWSIYHIIPVCKFDLTKEDEKLKCWNWSNLIPVTIEYNSSKKEIDNNQINNILQKIQDFKEKSSTTKWFSEDILTLDFINLKIVSS